MYQGLFLATEIKKAHDKGSASARRAPDYQGVSMETSANVPA